MKSRNLLLFGFALLAGLAVTLAAGLLARPYAYKGSLIDPPVEAVDFELDDQNGETFRLADQRGKVVLIFFGYTNCPDVCPVTLTKFKQLREQLRVQADEVRLVFISVDPERDTPEKLKGHLANYDPSIIGLTGSRSELEPVWEKFFVFQARQETGSASGYVVDHTSRIYAVGPDGKLHLTYPFEMDVDAILEDVRHLIKGDIGPSSG